MPKTCRTMICRGCGEKVPVSYTLAKLLLKSHRDYFCSYECAQGETQKGENA